LLNDYNYNYYLNEIIDVENNEIEYQKLKDFYKEKYNIYNVDFKKIMEFNKISDNYYFRGHDFFKILKLYMKRKNIKLYILEENNIEKNFIVNSTSFMWIIRSDLYKAINGDFVDCFINKEIIR